MRGPHPIKVLDMARPIDIHDSVWISELTALEVRDLIKVRENNCADSRRRDGRKRPLPYLGKHNTESLAMGEAIARKLGNTLMRASYHARARQPGDSLLLRAASFFPRQLT